MCSTVRTNFLYVSLALVWMEVNIDGCVRAGWILVFSWLVGWLLFSPPVSLAMRDLAKTWNFPDTCFSKLDLWTLSTPSIYALSSSNVFPLRLSEAACFWISFHFREHGKHLHLSPFHCHPPHSKSLYEKTTLKRSSQIQIVVYCCQSWFTTRPRNIENKEIAGRHSCRSGRAPRLSFEWQLDYLGSPPSCPLHTCALNSDLDWYLFCLRFKVKFLLTFV